MSSEVVVPGGRLQYPLHEKCWKQKETGWVGGELPRSAPGSLETLCWTAGPVALSLQKVPHSPMTAMKHAPRLRTFTYRQASESGKHISIIHAQY